MPSPICVRAIEDTLKHKRAILKFISPNDVGLTGGHQQGYYLPRKNEAWKIFTDMAPIKGQNTEDLVKVLWQDGRETASCVKWYGKGTRSEYRITRFQKEFPWMTADAVGDLLVLIPVTRNDFLGYVLDLEEDIIEIQAALGMEILETWAAYLSGREIQPVNEDECIESYFRQFANLLDTFPPSIRFSEKTRETLINCISKFEHLSFDDQLRKCIDGEYRLFRMVERKICQPQIVRMFRDVDDFIETAASIMNRRKSRAGHSLENHVEFLLRNAGIPFDRQPQIDGKIKPDILIPSKAAYEDSSYPIDKLRVIGIKRTCKDRWRQVLNEARRIPHKHILTLQEGISVNQLQEMHTSGVTLIVPRYLRNKYPPGSDINIQTLEEFISISRLLLT